MASPPNTSSSSELADLPDLKTTPDGVAAQREIAKLQRVPTDEYSAFLAQFARSHETLRDRPGPRGERFTL
jgi:hypothetical protein